MFAVQPQVLGGERLALQEAISAPYWNGFLNTGSVTAQQPAADSPWLAAESRERNAEDLSPWEPAAVLALKGPPTKPIGARTEDVMVSLPGAPEDGLSDPAAAVGDSPGETGAPAAVDNVETQADVEQLSASGLRRSADSPWSSAGGRRPARSDWRSAAAMLWGLVVPWRSPSWEQRPGSTDPRLKRERLPQ